MQEVIAESIAQVAGGFAVAIAADGAVALSLPDPTAVLRQDNQKDIGGGDPSVIPTGPKKTIDDLVSEARPGDTSKGRSTQFDKTGSYQEVLQDFESLNLKDVKDISSEWCAGKKGTLEDGRTVVVRESSKGKIGETGPPALEIQKIHSKDKIKFRYRD